MKVTFEMDPDSNLRKEFVVSAKNCRDVEIELVRPRKLQIPWKPFVIDKEAGELAKFHSRRGSYKTIIDRSTKFILEVTFSEQIGIFYPKWKQLRSQPSVVQEKWKEMIRQAEKHEEGIHWEQYRKKKAEVENFLRSKTNYTSSDLTRYLKNVDDDLDKEQKLAHEKAPPLTLDCP